MSPIHHSKLLIVVLQIKEVGLWQLWGGIPENPSQEVRSDVYDGLIRTWSDIRDISAFAKKAQLQPKYLNLHRFLFKPQVGDVMPKAKSRYLQINRLLRCNHH
jgi:hypothetical protein